MVLGKSLGNHPCVGGRVIWWRVVDLFPLEIKVNRFEITMIYSKEITCHKIEVSITDRSSRIVCAPVGRVRSLARPANAPPRRGTHA